MIIKLRHYLAFFFIRYIQPILIKQREKKVGKKNAINVVFLAINISMWRYQEIYELLKHESRFRVFVVLSAATTISKEDVISDLTALRFFFNKNGIDFIDFNEIDWRGYDLNRLQPDIIFYPQPYDEFCVDEHDYKRYTSKLLCFVPYGIGQTEEAWFYNTPFHNLAWKLYYPFPVDKERAKKLSKNRGANMVISGYTNFAKYLVDDAKDVWKLADKRLKRLIWAPHFSIGSENTLYSHSNFLWMSELMLNLAIEYKDKIQIAFKPHPRLKSELYRHKSWGKKRTDEYYDVWSNMENTFFENGDFIDLFKTSDAMIHDCSSFSIEYLFVNNPVAFVTRDISSLFKDLPKFGQEAIMQHYILKNEKDIRSWIIDVVLNGNDSMKPQRSGFYEKQLKPSVDISTSQFIVNDIKASLGINE